MSLPECDHVCKPAREKLQNKRNSLTRACEHNGAGFTMTSGFYPDGRVGEVFLNAAHANSALDAIVSDAAIAISLALQFGCPLDDLRHAMKRDARGAASSLIGQALDLLATEQAI
jgi:hypothetical protein